MKQPIKLIAILILIVLVSALAYQQLRNTAYYSWIVPEDDVKSSNTVEFNGLEIAIDSGRWETDYEDDGSISGYILFSAGGGVIFQITKTSAPSKLESIWAEIGVSDPDDFLEQMKLGNSKFLRVVRKALLNNSTDGRLVLMKGRRASCMLRVHDPFARNDGTVVGAIWDHVNPRNVSIISSTKQMIPTIINALRNNY
jgi:hypothetical protein